MTSPPDAVAVNGSPTLLKVEDQQNAILPDVRDYPKDSSRHSSASPEQELTNQPHPKIEKPSRPQEMSSGIICSVTGSSHTSLLEFGIHICPRCDHHVYGNNENDSAREGGLLKVINAKSSTTSKDGHRNVDSESEVVIQIKQIREDVNWFTSKLKEGLSESELDDEAYETDEGALSDEDHSEGGISKANAPPTAMEGAGDQQQGETVSKSLRDGKQSQVENAANAKSPQEETGLHHEIEFRDEGGYLLHRKRWRGPFNLDEARKGIKAHERKTIAKISTILVTNIPKDDDRSEKERIRISKEGFLRNSRVEFKHMKQQMVVRSKAFIEVLRDMVKYYPSINLQADALILTSPFCILAHHMAELQSLTALQTETELTTGESHMEASQLHEQDDNKERHSATAVDHIEKVLYFMRTNLISDQLDAEQARHARDPPMCTFGMMWLLYKPGTTVYVKDAYGKAKAYVVERFEVDETVSAILERSQPYIVILWNLSSDGTYVRRSREELTIGSFDGERPILDLKVIPASFVDASDGGKTREQLVQRGRKWYKMLTGAQQWHYSGQTVSWDKKTINSRVVVDIGSFLKDKNMIMNEMGNFQVQDMGEDLPICPCEKCLGCRPHPPKGFLWTAYDLIHPEFDDLELPEEYKDRDHRSLLCSGLLVGFVLKSRTWEELDVDRCQPANINTKAIDTLVMPDERKRMIKAIVQKYTDPMFTPGQSAATWGADFIETKGEGQIFLLHGGPGVGKTYTAECISELIGRPLLSLTCADFGTDEEAMEQRLSKWFKLAESWGAVMLLDEADVWLERRMISDLKRNTLVAVFLRCLEYYRGIMFLTSNRVGTFDDAFISRIHVIIYYEDLGEAQRKQIWKQFFDKLERERKATIIVESRAKHFVLNDSEMRKVPWNGREIRNAFQTAVSLAEYRYQYEGGKDESERIVLDKVDFEQVCQMSIDFKEYLTRVHRGDDESDRAMRERARA